MVKVLEPLGETPAWMCGSFFRRTGVSQGSTSGSNATVLVGELPASKCGSLEKVVAEARRLCFDSAERGPCRSCVEAARPLMAEVELSQLLRCAADASIGLAPATAPDPGWTFDRCQP